MGTLLLGGKPRADESVPDKAVGAVASRALSPRIHVIRLPQPADKSVAATTPLRSKAS